MSSSVEGRTTAQGNQACDTVPSLELKARKRDKESGESRPVINVTVNNAAQEPLKQSKDEKGIVHSVRMEDTVSFRVVYDKSGRCLSRNEIPRSMSSWIDLPDGYFSRLRHQLREAIMSYSALLPMFEQMDLIVRTVKFTGFETLTEDDRPAEARLNELLNAGHRSFVTMTDQTVRYRKFNGSEVVFSLAEGKVVHESHSNLARVISARGNMLDDSPSTWQRIERAIINDKSTNTGDLNMISSARADATLAMALIQRQINMTTGNARPIAVSTTFGWWVLKLVSSPLIVPVLLLVFSFVCAVMLLGEIARMSWLLFITSGDFIRRRVSRVWHLLSRTSTRFEISWPLPSTGLVGLTSQVAPRSVRISCSMRKLLFACLILLSLVASSTLIVGWNLPTTLAVEGDN